jgi:secreted Zn-dependent insulinase-like peptidase
VYSEDDILIGETVFMEYNHNIVQHVLNQLIPENMLIFVTSKEFSASKKEPWYGTSYEVQNFDLNVKKS